MKSAELKRISGNYNRYDAWCVHCGFAAVKLETLGLVKRRIAEHDASGYCAERGLEVAHYVVHKPDNWHRLRGWVHGESFRHPLRQIIAQRAIDYDPKDPQACGLCGRNPCIGRACG